MEEYVIENGSEDVWDEEDDMMDMMTESIARPHKKYRSRITTYQEIDTL